MTPIVREGVGRLKRFLRPYVVSCLGRAPVTARFSGIGHILMFHRVIPREEISPWGMAAFEITPEDLEMIIRFFLDHRYRIISLDTMCDSLPNRTEGDKFVVLTFDDGYRDTLVNAYPILKAYDAPFTVNVTTNYAERAAIKWDYLAEDIVRGNDTVVIESRRGTVEFDCSTWENKRRSCHRLQGILYEMNNAESSDDIQSFFSAYLSDIYRKTDQLMLDWTQIERLARDPLVTIGAHSVNHYLLSTLSNKDAGDEILRSKTQIEARLDMEVTHFTYPFGDIHEAGAREYEAVRKLGFRTGSTGLKGNIFREQSNRLESLPRFCLGSNCTSSHLSAIVNGSLPFLANRFHRLPNLGS